MRYLVLLVVFITHTPVYSQVKKKENVKRPAKEAKGKAVFDKEIHDFGTIMESAGPVQVVFTFINKGTGPIRILNVATSCGCTTPEWDKEDILPGQKGRIVGRYDPKDRAGEFSRPLTVFTDGDPDVKSLTLRGRVMTEKDVLSSKFPFSQGNMLLSNNVADFKTVHEYEPDTFFLHLYNVSKKHMRINNIVLPPHIKSTGQEQTLIASNGLILRLIYFPELAKDMGERRDEILIYTTDDSVSLKRVIAKATILPGFSKRTPEEKATPPQIVFKEKMHDFGEVYLSERVNHSFEVSNKGKSDLIIKEASGVCGCTVSNVKEPVVIKKGKKANIDILFDASKMRGAQEKTISVYSNDPENPVQELKIRAKVVVPGRDF